MQLLGDTRTAPARPVWRSRGAKCVLVAALLIHASLLLRGGSDPHKLFGFRPFNESDTWSVEIVSVTHSGERAPVDDELWESLIGHFKLRGLDRARHASAGASASIDFLDRALDWAVEGLPPTSDIVTFEATATVYRNTRGPETIFVTSADG